MRLNHLSDGDNPRFGKFSGQVRDQTASGVFTARHDFDDVYHGPRTRQILDAVQVSEHASVVDCAGRRQYGEDREFLAQERQGIALFRTQLAGEITSEDDVAVAQFGDGTCRRQRVRIVVSFAGVSGGRTTSAITADGVAQHPESLPGGFRLKLTLGQNAGQRDGNRVHVCFHTQLGSEIFNAGQSSECEPRDVFLGHRMPVHVGTVIVLQRDAGR